MNKVMRKVDERFRIAVQNFGRSCIDMKANEKAFQAWYAASIVQEFGLSRVYREIHLAKPELAGYVKDIRFKQLLKKNGSLRATNSSQIYQSHGNRM